MTKGAIVSGLGVALLLGGGGTLAVWNADQASNAGAITAGDLNLTAHKGVWTSNVTGQIGDVNDYRVVPGETLTYEQPVTVALVGDGMKAKLSVTGSAANEFVATDGVTVSDVNLTNKDGVSVSDELTPAVDGAFTASTTFAFSATDSHGRAGVTKSYDLSEIHYFLEQIAPTTN
ncbi:alternate-type signal peptide domain-containing protein [Citricoccus sp. NPDC055426]|uniref:alternate-type signal peptide domain-containing protein n=1 Tax=Citricoccus sp. NPDC055426 TaxID=3155536 RepID=UPI00344368B6